MDIIVSPKNEQEERLLLDFLEDLHYNYQPAADEEEMDTTNYLLSNEANKRHLLESIQQAKEGKLTEIKTEDLFG